MNVRVSDQELELLGIINSLGPCTSEKVHEALNTKPQYLFVMRSLHQLVEKGLLQRVIINQKQLYKTSRTYSYIKNFLSNHRSQ